MRRAIARGRMVPQGLSTDPRYGHLSLKAKVLYPLLWINCDDQGRFSGDSDEIKYAACPSVKEISAEEITTILKEMEAQNLITVFSTSKTKAVQMLDWWEEQKLQWASPSRYQAPLGWTDHQRYHTSPTEIITENWPPTVLPSALGSLLGSKLQSPPLTTPPEKKQKKKEEIEEEEGRSPSALGSNSPSPSPVALSRENKKLELDIYQKFIECIPFCFGHEPTSKELCQIRDYSKELAAAQAPPQLVFDAFKEATAHNKLHLSYVRAVVLDWQGVERSRSP